MVVRLLMVKRMAKGRQRSRAKMKESGLGNSMAFRVRRNPRIPAPHRQDRAALYRGNVKWSR